LKAPGSWGLLLCACCLNANAISLAEKAFWKRALAVASFHLLVGLNRTRRNRNGPDVIRTVGSRARRCLGCHASRQPRPRLRLPGSARSLRKDLRQELQQAVRDAGLLPVSCSSQMRSSNSWQAGLRRARGWRHNRLGSAGSSKRTGRKGPSSSSPGTAQGVRQALLRCMAAAMEGSSTGITSVAMRLRLKRGLALLECDPDRHSQAAQKSASLAGSGSSSGRTQPAASPLTATAAQAG